MTPNVSSDVFVSVSATRLRDFRDTQIALAELVQTCRKNEEVQGTLPYGTLLYVERQLSRDAAALSEWLGEFEQGTLPF